MDASERIRIDKWLWATRLFKTRSRAADAIERGHVHVNGERCKPAHEARVGDRIDILVGEARREVVVRRLAAQRGPAPVAQQLYEETVDSVARRERRQELFRYGAEPARAIKGRPTKRDGRRLRSARGSVATE